MKHIYQKFEIEKKFERMIRCLFSLVATTMMMLPLGVLAQGVQLGNYITNTSPAGSDNTIKISWSGIPAFEQFGCSNFYHNLTLSTPGVDIGIYHIESHEYSIGTGSYTKEIGPSQSGTISLKYDWGANCNDFTTGSTISYSTAKLHKPKNFTATMLTSPKLGVKFKWDKGTTISDDKISFRIYRFGELIKPLMEQPENLII